MRPAVEAVRVGIGYEIESIADRSYMVDTGWSACLAVQIGHDHNKTENEQRDSYVPLHMGFLFYVFV